MISSFQAAFAGILFDKLRDLAGALGSKQYSLPAPRGRKPASLRRLPGRTHEDRFIIADI
jgi:hypothetical protein